MVLEEQDVTGLGQRIRATRTTPATLLEEPLAAEVPEEIPSSAILASLDDLPTSSFPDAAGELLPGVGELLPIEEIGPSTLSDEVRPAEEAEPALTRLMKATKRLAHARKALRSKPKVKPMHEPHPRNGNGRHANGHAPAKAKPLVTLKSAKPRVESPEQALAWLEGLAKRVQASSIPLLLDYYRKLGWIPSDAYGWIVELASGVTKNAQAATWRLVKAQPALLAAVHRQSYKRLRAMFGDRVAVQF